MNLEEFVKLEPMEKVKQLQKMRREQGSRLNWTMLQAELYPWAIHNFPNATPMQPFMGMVEELGELSHALLKKEQGIRGTVEEHDEAIVDALADIAIYMADFANRNDINLQNVIERVWNKVSQRDWINFPKNGVSE